MTDMKMSDRPLMVDVSVHQTYIDLDKARQAGNDVKAIIMRASVGLNKDADFDAFDEFYDWNELHRASYHALWPTYDWKIQIDNLLEIDPEGVYMLDMELTNGMSAHYVAEVIVLCSNYLLEKTGKRPLMYGAFYFLEDNLMPFVPEEWVNEHWWLLASYGDGDADEDDGWSILIPTKINPDQVFGQQTTDQASLYPGGEHVDRDRFLLGDEDDLDDWWAQYTGKPVDPGLPEGEHVHPDLVDGIMMLDEATNARLVQLESENERMTQAWKDLKSLLEIQHEINIEQAGQIIEMVEAFKKHSKRQVEANVVRDALILSNKRKAHVHRTWRERFFKR